MESNIEVSDLGAQALTKWKNPPTLENLKADLLESRSIHDAQVSTIDGWLDNLHVTNKAKVVAPKGNSSIVPKLIRKQAEWRYPALSDPFLSTDDVFNVRPVTWEDRNAAKQNELMLNYQFNCKIDKVAFIDEYVRTAVEEGTAIIRVGWEFEEEEYEDEVPQVQFQVNPELAPMHEQLEQMRAESPSQYDTDVPDELKQAHDMSLENGVPIEAVITGQHKETKIRTVRNHLQWMFVITTT